MKPPEILTEAGLVRLVARVAPWGAPVPGAWFVGQASYEVLKVPAPVAVIIAVTLEALGLTLTSTFLAFHSWNLKKMRKEFKAPAWLASLFVGVYLAVTVGLTVVLKVAPALAVYAPVIFPFLALTGTVQLVLLAQHDRRVADHAKAYAKSEGETVKSKSKRAKAKKGRKDTRERARVLLVENPDLSGTALAEMLGCSASWGSKLKRELAGDGRGGSS